MPMAEIEAGVSDTEVQAIGTGTTDNSSAVLCRVGLTANERAAHIRAVAYSDLGDEARAEALAVMVPEEGYELVGISDASGQIELSSPTVVDFSVSGGSGPANWIGKITILFTQNYAA